MTVEERNNKALENSRLVYKIMKELNIGKDEWDDVFQNGFLGLLRAVELYDSNVGALSTYSRYWILQGIYRGFSDDDLIHIPENAKKDAKRVIKQWDESGHKLRLKDFCKEIGFDYQKILDANVKAVAYDNHWQRDDDDRTIEFAIIGDEYIVDETNRNFVCQKLYEALDQIPPRESEVLKKLYGIGCVPMTLQEVGKIYDVSRERIRQIKNEAERRLRYILRNTDFYKDI